MVFSVHEMNEIRLYSNHTISSYDDNDDKILKKI